MLDTCLQKQNTIKKLFSECKSKEQIYQKIIEIGKNEPQLSPEFKIPENEVPGCQSLMYLHAYYENGNVYFKADSEALISFGLAALLIRVYSGETPEAILTCPPNYLEEIGISSSLSPNRANGLYQIHLKMKQKALQYLGKISK
jgi:cysteine desulfuration protein SufE